MTLLTLVGSVVILVVGMVFAAGVTAAWYRSAYGRRVEAIEARLDALDHARPQLRQR